LSIECLWPARKSARPSEPIPWKIPIPVSAFLACLHLPMPPYSSLGNEQSDFSLRIRYVLQHSVVLYCSRFYCFLSVASVHCSPSHSQQWSKLPFFSKIHLIMRHTDIPLLMKVNKITDIIWITIILYTGSIPCFPLRLKSKYNWLNTTGNLKETKQH
jgi:hypothetical protein